MTKSSEELIVGIGLYYEDFTIGKRMRTIGRSITEVDLVNFVGVTGMTEVLFTNLEYLEHESPIKGRLVPGTLVLCIAEGLLMQYTLQHTGIAFLGMELKIERPVFAGDTLHVALEVIEVRETKKSDRGFVRTRNDVVNQRGETVLTYTPARLVKRHG